MSCKEYGNTSSASIPITMSKEFYERGITGKKKLLLCGFGIGLSWGINVIEVNANDVMPVIETDYVYTDRNKFVFREES
jgi:3-oxoacyl-[acyl-carrier-protein] synthase-3